MITKEYLQQELAKRIDGYKRGVETDTDNIIAEMKSILVLVDALPDYEKRYNEALEVMRQWIAPCHTKKQLDVMKESVFPELRESEDERIRKYLIDELKVAKSVGELKYIIPQPTREECIAYLENQKEQKHCWRPTETDVALFNKAVTTNKTLTPTERAQLDIIRSKFGYCRAANCSGIVQKEQNPTQSNIEKEYIRTIKSLIADFLRGKCDIDTGYYQKIYDWLDGRHVEQKPTWSEEDEDAIQQAILALEDRYDEHEPNLHFLGYKLPFNKAAERLKFLRPSWKPSKEQMDALETTAHLSNFGCDIGRRNTLLSLCNDLKKL